MSAPPKQLRALLDRHIAAGRAVREEERAEESAALAERLLALPAEQRVGELASAGAALTDEDRERVVISLSVTEAAPMAPRGPTQKEGLPPALARLKPGETLDINAVLRPPWWRHPAIADTWPRLLAGFLVVLLCLVGAIVFGVR